METELRMGRFVEVLSVYKSKRLSCLEAAIMMGVSERHFRRLRDKYDDVETSQYPKITT